MGGLDDDAHRGIVSAQVDAFADELVWNRIGVGVEVDTGLLGYDERQYAVGVEGVTG